MSRSIVEPEVKEEIISQALNGVRVAELATKYAVNPVNIYQWVNKAKEKSGEIKPKREGSSGLALVNLDEQIEALTIKYQKDLKALLLKQVMQALQGV